MFHNDWSLLQLAKERERDIVRKLEHNRLVREAELTSRPHRHTVYHVLDWVGRQLVRWGERCKRGTPCAIARCDSHQRLTMNNRPAMQAARGDARRRSDWEPWPKP
jgi:hypothetical protein